MRRAWNIALWVLGVGALVLLLAFEGNMHGRETVKSVSVEILQPGEQLFLNREDILQLAEKQYSKVVGRAMSGINTNLLEETLENQPHILRAEVFSTLDGKLFILVEQKQAIARIINTQKYLDAQGNTFPTSKNYSATVPVITGVADSAALAQAYALITEIKKHAALTNWLAEIHISPKHEITLVPINGRHTVVLGDDTNTTDKLNRLIAFYTTVVTPSNLSQYKTLNLKYNNLLISTKYTP